MNLEMTFIVDVFISEVIEPKVIGRGSSNAVDDNVSAYFAGVGCHYNG
jgi:hypothetical protein